MTQYASYVYKVYIIYFIKYVILGYRDDSLKTVAQNRDDYGIPLKILSYKELYGWTMDAIVAEVKHTWWILLYLGYSRHICKNM